MCLKKNDSSESVPESSKDKPGSKSVPESSKDKPGKKTKKGSRKNSKEETQVVSRPKVHDCLSKQNTSATKQNSPGTKKNNSGAKQSNSGSKQNNGAAKQNTSATKLNSPATKQNSPAKKQNSPNTKQNAPANKQNSPTNKQAKPASRQNSNTSEKGKNNVDVKGSVGKKVQDDREEPEKPKGKLKNRGVVTHSVYPAVISDKNKQTYIDASKVWKTPPSAVTSVPEDLPGPSYSDNSKKRRSLKKAVRRQLWNWSKHTLKDNEKWGKLFKENAIDVDKVNIDNVDLSLINMDGLGIENKFVRRTVEWLLK